MLRLSLGVFLFATRAWPQKWFQENVRLLAIRYRCLILDVAVRRLVAMEQERMCRMRNYRFASFHPCNLNWLGYIDMSTDVR